MSHTKHVSTKLTLSVTASILFSIPVSSQAADVCISSSNTASGSVTSVCDLGSGESLTVLSGASISTTTDSAVISSGAAGDIINAGTIHADSNHAIYNNSALNSITNQASGQITSGAGYSAIFNENATTVGDITNNGTVDGGNSGIFNGTGSTTGAIVNGSGATIKGNLYHGIHNLGTTDSIDNAGSIIGAASQYAIINDGIITNGITNSGLLDGKVKLGDATLNLNGSSARITGLLEGSSSSIVNINGSFNSESTIDVGLVNINSSGSLNLAHTLTASSASGVDNNGMLSVANGVTAQIVGNYNQTSDGTLKLGAVSNTDFGKLVVTDTANFDAGTNINIDVASINSLANGQTLSGVVSAGTLNASSFNLSDNSTLFNFKAIINGNNLDLDIIKVANIIDSVNVTGLRSGVGAAKVLDDLSSKEGNTGDLAVVVTALGNLNGDKAISSAVAQTLPLLTGASTQININTLRSINNVIAARQSETMGLSSGDGLLTERHLWLKPVGSWSHQSDHNGVGGYRADSYGLVGGIDGDINDTTTLGFAISYMNSNIDGTGSAATNSAKIDTYQAIFYGSYRLENMPAIELNWQADAGLNKNEGKRDITFVNRTAESDYDSYSGHLGFGAGHHFQISDSTLVIPSIRLDYTYIKDESYDETGADSLNLKVKSNSTQELVALMKGNLTHSLSEKLSLAVDVGVGYDFINDQNSITSSYAGGGAVFITKGIDPSPWLARVGAGVNYQLSDNSEVTAQYDVETRTRFVNQTASVKFNWLF